MRVLREGAASDRVILFTKTKHSLSVVDEDTFSTLPHEFSPTVVTVDYSRIGISNQQSGVVSRDLVQSLQTFVELAFVLFSSVVIENGSDSDGKVRVFRVQSHPEQRFVDGSPMPQRAGLPFADDECNSFQLILFLSSLTDRLVGQVVKAVCLESGRSGIRIALAPGFFWVDSYQ